MYKEILDGLVEIKLPEGVTAVYALDFFNEARDLITGFTINDKEHYLYEGQHGTILVSPKTK